MTEINQTREQLAMVMKELTDVDNSLANPSEGEINGFTPLTVGDEKFLSLVQLSGNIIYLTDYNGNYTFINKTGCMLLECTEEEILNTPLINTIHPDDRQASILKFAEILKGGTEMFDYEDRFVSRSGKVIYVSHKIRVLRDETGKFAGTEGIAMDISRQKAAEAKIIIAGCELEKRIIERTSGLNNALVEQKEKEKKLSVLLGNLPGIACRYTNYDNWTLEYIGEGCFELTGYTPEELVNNPIFPINNYVHKDFHGYLYNKWTGVLSRNESFNAEYKINTREGNEKWVWERGKGIYSENGQLIAMEGFITDITERKNSEIALIEKELQLRNILENSTNVFYYYSASHVLNYLSPQIKNILGYEVDEALTKWAELTSDNPINEIGYNKTVKAIETGLAQDPFELELIHKSGRKVWIEIRETPIVVNGKTTAIVGSFHDITERKKTEEEIPNNVQQLLFHLELNSLMDAPIQEVYDYVNSAVSKMVNSKLTVIGLVDDTESIITFPAHPKINTGDHSAINHPLHFTVAESGVWGNCVRERRPVIINSFDDSRSGKIDIPTSNIEVSRFVGIPVFDGDKIVAIALVANKENEYTEKDVYSISAFMKKAIFILRANESGRLLKLNEAKFKSIFESKLVGIFFWNANGDITDANDVFLDLIGYTKDEVHNNLVKWKDITPAEYQGKDDLIIKELEQKGYIKPFEKEFFHKNGHRIPVIIGSVTLSGSSTDGIAFALDFTEPKQIENELISAKNKAEERERLKSAFLANMSHEIRSPMNGIIGFAELLKEPNLPLQQQQLFVELIEKSGVRLLGIINDIIDISKIEAGQTMVSFSETDINMQLDFIHSFFKHEAKKKGLHLFVNKLLSDNEAIINTDREKVYAILTNLVKNALKFTASGSVEIGCEKKGEFLEFFVKDTGYGVSKEQKEIIFERFKQGSEMHSRDHEGAGLGLSISKAYAEMLGGSIWVENNPYSSVDGQKGNGSIFYFTILSNIESVKENSSSEGVIDNEYKEEVKKLKILLAEDDELSEIFLLNVVQKYGKEVILAKTGTEAVEICRKNPDIDLILMDVRMPQMDGYKATKKIRQFNKNVVIIAQTAYGLAGERERAIAAGCNNYISKPINTQLLKEIITEPFL